METRNLVLNGILMIDPQQENPYDSPHATSPSLGSDASTSDRIKWYLILAIVAVVLSFVPPFVGIPIAFLLAPAFVRAWRMRQAELAEMGTESDRRFSMLVIASLLYAIPCAIASVIAFGCVCLPTMTVGNAVLGVSGGRQGPNYLGMFVGGASALLVSTFAGLWVGDYVLRRNRYFLGPTAEEKATVQPEEEAN